MSAPESRVGRPRHYDLTPAAGFCRSEAAWAAAALDELRERAFDLIADLPPQLVDFVPPGANNSIAMLMVHMAWAEASWIGRLTQAEIAPDLWQQVLPGRQDQSGELPPFSADSAALIALCRRVRDEWTVPVLAALTDLDVALSGNWDHLTRRGVLMHLAWHWANHTGQVGLLRRMAGARYRWTFA